MKHFDHLVLPVRDLDSACAALKTLGFQVLPKGHHPALLTYNHLMMLHDVYLEIITTYDENPNKTGPGAFIADGLPGLAFKSSDISADCNNLQARGVAVRPVIEFGRPVMIDSIEVEARFKAAIIDPQSTPSCFMFMVDHMTPDYVWRPQWLKHDNQVKKIERIFIVNEDLKLIKDKYEVLFDAGRLSQKNGEVTISAGHCEISFVNSKTFLEMFPEFESSKIKDAKAITLTTSDLPKLRKKLQDDAIFFHPSADNSIWLQIKELNGTVLNFVQSM